ncbi:MAG: CoA ester lyase [Acidobacteria bacterium]|nr:CoA ester lyase [Acidobacteriota bacterium]MBI3422624.1 CoA ester lyase [Acidobacteriota bacterium]
MAARALFRSYLFAPGDNEKLLRKVFTAGADAVVLDLEDAVAADNKAPARQLITAALQVVAGSACKLPAIYLRINAISTQLWQDDIAIAAHPLVHGIRLSKAESLAELQAADHELAAAESRAGLAVGSLRIVPTIESAAGLLNAAELARHPRVETFSFGAADFAKDIGAEVDAQETQTLFARSQLVVVARAAGLKPPIAAVYTQLKDLAGLRASSEAQRRLGFFGRSCIHPSQLTVIHEVFTPQAAAVNEAQAIVAAFEQAQTTGAAVTTLANGQFVDAPLVERARAVLSLAEAFAEAMPDDAV